VPPGAASIEEDDMTASQPTRRQALAIGGVGVGALTMTACDSSTGTATPSTASLSAAAGSSSGSGASVPVSQVPVGGGVVVTERQVVITQPTAGTFKAFSSICTHEGCPVTSVTGGHILCPCHNTKFDIATGAVLSGPAKKPLPAKNVTVSGDTLTIA